MGTPPDKIRYFHARRMELVAMNGKLEARPHARGGLTFAYANVSPDMIQLAVARCMPTDHYNKRDGSSRARDRLQRGDGTLLPMKGDAYTTIWQYLMDNRQLRRNMRCELRHSR